MKYSFASFQQSNNSLFLHYKNSIEIKYKTPCYYKVNVFFNLQKKFPRLFFSRLKRIHWIEFFLFKCFAFGNEKINRRSINSFQYYITKLRQKHNIEVLSPLLTL